MVNMRATLLIVAALLLVLVPTSRAEAESQGSPINVDYAQALQGLCNGVAEFQGDNCPYYHAYLIANQLVQGLNGDGGNGLWPNLWWQSGQGLWYIAEYLLAMEGAQSTDMLYFGIRWAAENTIKTQNGYRPTDFTDDSAWWANGAGRMNQYIQKYRGDSSANLVNAVRGVVNDNTKNHFDQKCGGGIYWQWGDGVQSPKTAISNLLTMNAELILNNIAPDNSLVQGTQTSALGLYNWMKDQKILIPSKGTQSDGVDPNKNCAITDWTFTYEFGVLIQALIQLAPATGQQVYMADCKNFASWALNRWASKGVIDDGCDSNNCAGDGMAFRGVWVQALGQYYEATKDAATSNVIRQSWASMLRHRQGSYYPMGWLNGDSGKLTGVGLAVSQMTNLALAVSAIKVFKGMKGSSPNVDAALPGLLPFGINNGALLRVCLCNDWGCPFTHSMTCFTDDGHQEQQNGQNWRNNVQGFLVGPSHQVILWKANNGGASPWYTTSQWYSGYNVDSVNVDHY